MRLVTFDLGKEARAGLWLDGWVADLEKGAKAAGAGKLPASVKALLESGDAGLARARRAEAKLAKMAAAVASGKTRRPAWLFPAGAVHLGPPLPDPEKIVCLGLNYADHAKEQEKVAGRVVEAPKAPMVFAKWTSALIGPFDPIRLPSEKTTKLVDYEVELAAVIGRTTKAVSKKDAMACVAGYMVLNDVSARDCQAADKQFTRAKSFDTFAPCGPWILTADEVPDPHRLRLWTLFNGELMQDASTRLMIHKIPNTISYLSQAMTLKPGDILSTGTPAGVGMFRQEQTLLRPGVAIECGVEGVGVIRNRVERG